MSTIKNKKNSTSSSAQEWVSAVVRRLSSTIWWRDEEDETWSVVSYQEGEKPWEGDHGLILYFPRVRGTPEKEYYGGKMTLEYNEEGGQEWIPVEGENDDGTVAWLSVESETLWVNQLRVEGSHAEFWVRQDANPRRLCSLEQIVKMEFRTTGGWRGEVCKERVRVRMDTPPARREGDWEVHREYTEHEDSWVCILHRSTGAVSIHRDPGDLPFSP